MFSRTPSKQLGFFKNYKNHMDCIKRNLLANQQLSEIEPNLEKLPVVIYSLMAGGLKRASIGTAFYDRYDITDELMGATVLPTFLSMIASPFLLRIAATEACIAIAIRVGLMTSNGEAHKDRAVEYLLVALSLQVYAYVYFIKSIISLVTRSFFTLNEGFKDPENPRFHYKSLIGAENGASDRGCDRQLVFSNWLQ